MRSKVRTKVRSAELMARAHLRLVEIYAALASRGEHLFAKLLAGQQPRQWAHYPQDDAIDSESGFQWFYHSHSKEDRPGSSEHGHIHLFARRKLWARRLRSRTEIEFAKLGGEPPTSVNTRHLLTISFDAKGVPTCMFTVNSWVSGDRMLSARLTAELLGGMVLDTGNPEVDGAVESLVAMYQVDIEDLLARRDGALLAWKAANVLSDERLEVLSEFTVNVDEKFTSV